MSMNSVITAAIAGSDWKFHLKADGMTTIINADRKYRGTGVVVVDRDGGFRIGHGKLGANWDTDGVLATHRAADEAELRSVLQTLCR